MADNNKKKYQPTLAGSISAGIGSVFGSGRRYYVLEHRTATTNHKAGQTQEIILDKITLGRKSNCQVRFGDDTPTVSREHAYIVKEGSGWKIVNLSTTNPTLVNGKAINKEWFLQNGDEIQLSAGGPRMGFIEPAGKQGTVGSLSMTRRLSLFQQQALRPYKMWIGGLAAALVIAVAGLTTLNVLMRNDFERQMADARLSLQQMLDKNADLRAKMDASAAEQARLAELVRRKGGGRTVIIRQSGGKGYVLPPATQTGDSAGTRPAPPATPDTPTTPDTPEQQQQPPMQQIAGGELTQYEPDVYFIYVTKVVVTLDDGTQVPLQNNIDGRPSHYGWSGTGFLLDDGRFVTARHCVEGWRFFNNGADFFENNVPNDSVASLAFLLALTGEAKIETHMEAYSSKNDKIELRSSQFKMDRSGDRRFPIGAGNIRVPKADLKDGSDWAYANIGKRGSIHADADFSRQIPAGTELNLYGFPSGKGYKDDGQGGITPVWGSCRTARKGLVQGVIEINARNFAQGNSGGPVFAKKDNQWKVVGIVSYSEVKADNFGGIVPMCNLKK